MIRSLYFIIILLSLVLFQSCYKNLVNNPIEDKAPDTHLFLIPDSTISKQSSSLKVSWSGDDPDGLVIGFYFKWDGLDSLWNFTQENDSTFSLYIGTKDTTYKFLVAAVDNYGNGVYDSKVIQNGIDFGPEPFNDLNGNGKHDPGEPFTDIGLIDPTPASLIFPIKNSSPTISWNSITILPDSSFPVMTLGWNANDLDGDNSIVSINIALNDTNNYSRIYGSARLITIRATDFNTGNPKMDILLNGLESNILPQKLTGLKLNGFNKIYIQAQDISGAKSPFVALPTGSDKWFVKKPRGKILIVDSYNIGSVTGNKAASDFYNKVFNSISGGAFNGKFDVLDLNKTPLPYQDITFWETIKLFTYIMWYADNKPPLDLMNYVTNKYTTGFGKIAFSMTFADSTNIYPFDLASLQGFLPVDSLGQHKSLNFLLRNADVIPYSTANGYPDLKTSSTVSYIRTFYPNAFTSDKIYELSSRQLSGNIAFETKNKSLFFIGLPLHLLDGNGNVQKLIDKIFIQEFGLTP